MRVLLDTQVALWAWAQPHRIPANLHAAITDSVNEVAFSQVSTWEIQIKHGLGRLTLPERPEQFLPPAIERSGFDYLPIQDAAILFLDRLPGYHRDPFDRLLIAQALTGHYHLATADEQVLRYPVLTVA